MKDPLEDTGAGVGRRAATGILLLVVVGLIALAIFRPGSRTALAIVVGLIVMVMLHEAGHYYTAKRAGMKVTEFFLGFGPRLWSFRRGETEYGVKAIPAGGYVRIVGMSNLEEVDPVDEPRTYRQASYKNRFVVVMAGVTVNVILAMMLFYVVNVGQGTPVGPSTTIAQVVKGSAADKAAFEEGDTIVSVDGSKIDDWDALKDAIEASGGKPATFVVERDGATREILATPKERDGQGFLGIAPGIEYEPVGLLAAIPKSFETLGDSVVQTGEGFARVFSPSGLEGQAEQLTSSSAPRSGSTASQERPIGIVGIVDQGSQIVNGNIWILLRLLAVISLLLAIVNALPLPPLDGGHAAVVGYEWAASKIQRRKVVVDYRRLMPVVAVVLAVFLTLGLSTAFLDIRQAVGK